jgi:osmoprotectant transport system permease protein
MSGLAILLGTAIAMPIGMLIGHTRRFALIAISLGNLGRAIPSFAILAFVFPFTFDAPGELGFLATLIAMILLTIPPVLTNTYAGITSIDPDMVEAARGMGMTGRAVLFRLELPLAAPLIVAGVRVAAVGVVATATLGALFGWGGLGRFLIDGFATRNEPKILGGAVLVAGLALMTEFAFGVVERLARSKSRARGEGRKVEPFREVAEVPRSGGEVTA